MNRKEYLLVCLSEEMGEVQQAIGKILRFGLDDSAPDILNAEPNSQLLVKEIHDVLALIGMVEAELNLTPTFRQRDQMIEKKQEKVERFMDYSRDRGTLC